MVSDWKDVVRTAAPALATILGSPLAGGAVKLLADAVLGDKASGDPVADEATLAGILAGPMTPELRARVIEAERALKAEMVKAGVETTRIRADVEKAYVDDVAKARMAHAQSQGVLRLGYIINAASYVTVGAVLYGCFFVMTGSGIGQIDPGIAAMLGSIVGAAVQWLFSNAAQANGFFFGSSPGSRQLSEQLGKAVGEAVQTSGDAPARSKSR